MRIRNYSVGSVLCSEEGVDATVEQKWKSVSFYPMDLPRRPHYGWTGIELTSNWRTTMYPPPLNPEEIPSKIDELALEYLSYQAPLFLLEVGQSAVLPLCRALNVAVDGTQKFRIADILVGLSRGQLRRDVPEDALSHAERYKKEYKSR